MDGIDRVARAFGCEYLSDLNYLDFPREQAEGVLRGIEPPLNPAELASLARYLGAQAPDDNPLAQCITLLSRPKST